MAWVLDKSTSYVRKQLYKVNPVYVYRHDTPTYQDSRCRRIIKALLIHTHKRNSSLITLRVV